eukprot:scaffold121920_cov27-Tisochrysis_lutea.AAC.5
MERAGAIVLCACVRVHKGAALYNGGGVWCWELRRCNVVAEREQNQEKAEDEDAGRRANAANTYSRLRLSKPRPLPIPSPPPFPCPLLSSPLISFPSQLRLF